MAPTGGPPGQTESEDDAIVRVAAFHRRDHYYGMPWLVEFNQQFQHPQTGVHSIPASITSPSSSAGLGSGLGILGKLPNELLADICRNLDVKSYLRFRQVCRFSRFFASELVEYRAVIDGAANCFLGVIRTDMWRCLTFSDLFRAMCTTHCNICGKLGPFVYLLTVTRCCRTCLYEHASFQTVTLASFTRVGHISSDKVRRSVPVLKSLKDLKYKRKSFELVNFEEATRIMNRSPTLDVGHGYSGMNTTSQAETRNMATAQMSFFHEPTQTVYETLSCKGCARDYSIAAVAVPLMVFNPPMNTRDAYHERVEGLKAEAAREYLKDGFLSHFKTCQKAKDLWLASGGGTVSIEHLETAFIRTGALCL
ncbi:hypothetical protein BR93DRAFT_971443 [Coniochaeta sp. PMI_546]|nr:hypothetical protein BR93DRAFT_971443 [Coniochaeta sp. PMI_546]